MQIILSLIFGVYRLKFYSFKEKWRGWDFKQSLSLLNVSWQ